jgi:hypothetical protein
MNLGLAFVDQGGCCALIVQSEKVRGWTSMMWGSVEIEVDIKEGSKRVNTDSTRAKRDLLLLLPLLPSNRDPTWH